MKNNRTIKIEELAILIDVSVQTINTWYKWKRVHPEHELASYLPDYVQKGSRKTRYWKSDDVWKIIQFKKSVVKGRNGVMGDVTQRRVKINEIEGGKTNGKKKNRNRNDK